MKETALLRRLLCVVLAVELVCAPLLAAGASGDPEAGNGGVEPLAEEQLKGQYLYDLGYGVPYELAGGKTAILAYEDIFAVEGAALSDGFYGQTKYTSEGSVPNNGDDKNFRTFCVFPPDSALGRVPDRQFEGWYILPAGGEGNDAGYKHAPQYDEQGNELSTKAWAYQEGMSRVEALSYEVSDPYYEVHGDKGDTWDGSREYGEEGYKPGATVGFVGRWVPSGDDSLSALNLTGVRASGAEKALTSFYREDIAGLPLTGENPTPQPFSSVPLSPEREEYWLRVDPDVTRLKLEFDTAEPFYDYHTGNGECPVELTVTFGGKETYRADFSNGGSQMLPEPLYEENTGLTIPQNSAEDPAHAHWAVKDEIPLSPSAGEQGLYNDFTIRITPPDGSTPYEYVIHVQRMSDPALTRSPGNTPAGMIARDTSAIWGSGEEMAANKAAAMEYFQNNFSFDPKLFPQDGSSFYGSIFKGNYSPKAWAPGAQNYDLQDSAIVVYQDAAFLDPGIALTDSEGYCVTLGEGKYAGTVERSLKLRADSSLAIGGVPTGKGQTCWYSGGRLVNEETWEIIKNADGSDQIDLRGLNVLPGIYSLEYRYTDPVMGAEKPYSSSDSGFAFNKGNATSFHRAVIVLPAPGDVDMDGAVTAADGVALEAALHQGGGASPTLAGADLNSDPAAALFAYRVCDLTHDGTLTQDDLAKLERGFQSVLNKLGDSDYFYPPLPTGDDGERYTRRTLEEATADVPVGECAQVRMEYLGVETGSYNASTGATANPSGPWNADKGRGVDVKDATTFWMGVRLDDVDKSLAGSGDLTNFTFTLTYDARYVKPAAVVTQAMIDDAGLDTFEKRWQGTLRIYDLGTSSQTIWGSGYDYKLTPFAAPELPYSTHYSKAIPPLERKVSRESDLRELAFSIQLQEGKTPTALKDGWLFAVPFALIRHPYGQTSAQLVELGAGMRDFVFVSNSTAARSGEGTGGLTAAAYSAQADIFGDATANLRTDVIYAEAGAAIPLGEDKSEVITLVNAVSKDGKTYYSQTFRSQDDAVDTLYDGEIRDLPPGIEFKQYVGLQGTPTKAGDYDFYIGDSHYRIVVEKVPLRFYTDSAATYYGQPEYRGVSDDFVFHYYPGDIQSRELERLREQSGNPEATPDGVGATLGELLQDERYTPPQFRAMDGDEAVAANSPVKEYPIEYLLLPTSTNYEFEYVTERPDEINTGTLSVLKRPVVVSHLRDGTIVGEVYSDTQGFIDKGLTAVSGAGKEECTFRLPDMIPDGTYENRPLTGNALVDGDRLTISYEATYIQEQKDKDNEGFFQLDSFREQRSIAVSNIRLLGKGAASNYELKSHVQADPVAGGVKGWVVRRNITGISIKKLPPMDYQYGDHLDSSNSLWIMIHKADQGEGDYSYSQETCDKYGLKVTWATEEEKAAGKPGSLPFQAGQTMTVAHDARYICVSAEVQEEGIVKVVTAYSQRPAKVERIPLTLTVLPLERYYGESNGDLTYAFTYNVNELAYDDRQAHSGLKGAGDELDRILASDEGYRRPVVQAVVSADDRTAVDADSPAGSYTILISGAKATNYEIRYTVSAPQGTTYSAVQGDSTLRVRPRPIVVDSIQAEKAADLVAIYADTLQISTWNLPLKLDEVEVVLPTHTDTTTTYFPKGGTLNNEPITVKPGYARDESGQEVAVLERDREKLSLTYTATVVPDNIYHTSFTNGYFQMEDANEAGEKTYDVQVTELALTGPAAKNYVLVYQNSGSSMWGMPTQTRLLENRPDPDGKGIKNYYAAGTGTVKLRPIKRIEITATPKLKYTYGEPFRPEIKDPDARTPLTVTLYYETEGDNYAGNTKSEVVKFGRASGVITTFDERSLVIYGVKEGQEKRRLSYQEYVTVADSGLHLIVEGRRGIHDELRTSEPTEAVLEVAPRPLKLNVADMERFYGEHNGDVTFSFDPGALAKPDSEALDTLKEKAEDQGKTWSNDSAALSDLAGKRNFVYEPPTLHTEATQSSPVVDGGRGGYPIAAQGGSLTNYELISGQGTLHIYRRPVSVKEFKSSYPDNPIYTIYADTKARTFDTDVKNESYVMQLPVGGKYSNEVNQHDLPLTGSAIYAPNGKPDVIPLKLKVTFDIKEGGDLGPLSGIQQPVYIDHAEIVPGSPALQNYWLLENNKKPSDNPDASGLKQPWGAWGAVNLRRITKIEVLQGPNDLEYTYGEALDLTGLRLLITYENLDSEGNQTEEISYVGRNQFQQHGLYVNYYDGDTAPTQQALIDQVPQGRVAQNGDHLTVAHTHDTQSGKAPFTANGMHLIVSARLHKDHTWVQPQLASTTAILVNPRQLDFTLTAEDKTYDGNTETAGTLTLTNVFNQSGYVDAYNKEGVTDMVYPVTGAKYESAWTSLAEGYADFKDYLTDRKGAYSFTTGSYVPNEPGPLGKNGYVQYIDEGYQHGEDRLSFRFLDANVAYAQPPAWDRYGAVIPIGVAVTGIRLEGPDAENYEIVGEVTPGTLETVRKKGYKAEALPAATIHKANREKLPDDKRPMLEVDAHTNVVRLTYNQTLAEAQPEAEAYQKETHFEYALQYAVNDLDAPIRWWAGEKGQAGFQDTRFFGGEDVAPALPEGYLPVEDDIPIEVKEDDILKGQLYRWAGEDSGFRVKESAYPGGTPYPGYELYETERDPLPRDTVVWGLVRVSETHNFNASPVLSSVAGLTPEMVQESADAQAEVKAALEALEDIPEGEDTGAAQDKLLVARTRAAEAAADVKEAVRAADDAARSIAAGERDYFTDLGEKGTWPEEWPAPAKAAPAVKTYTQRLDAIAVEERRGLNPPVGRSDGQFDVPILEAVWFTDVLEYPKKQTMDAVLRNNDPTRYYGYYWDAERSAELKFDDPEQPVDLTDPIENVEIKWTDENGQEQTGTITVNEKQTALLYVNTSGGGGGILENTIRIEPHGITSVLGSDPVQLSVTFDPTYVTIKSVSWTTSDAKVATVNRNGLVSFVGVGECTITAISINGRRDSIQVTVLDSWYDKYPASIFDLSYPNAFFVLQDTFFGPDVEMTRGELVQVLAQFYSPNLNWKGSGSGEFPDLAGVEPYAESARLLGSLGVITGTETGRFEGDRLVTRAELVAILTRMLGLEVPDTKGLPHAYRDSGEEDTWAYAYIDAVDRLGIVRGVGNGNFAPARPVTRAETAVILDRLLATGLDPTAQKLLQPTDVSAEHWAYPSIIRAINGSGTGPDPRREETD